MTLIMIDGLDGVGKGVILTGFKKYFQDQKQRIFDLHDYWNLHNFHPQFNQPYDDKGNYKLEFVDLRSFDITLLSEPTYVGIGKVIRDEVTAKSGRVYTTPFTAQLFSADRLVLGNRVVVPARSANKIIIQSRGIPTSVAYQSLQAREQKETFSIDDILGLEGNLWTLQHNMPDLLIIPTIKNPDELMSRLQKRDKNDNSKFENLEFQLKLKEIYESAVFKELFENKGVRLEYIDASISVEETQKQAIDAYERFVGKRS